MEDLSIYATIMYNTAINVCYVVLALLVLIILIGPFLSRKDE
jgi:hypothetical protein